MLHCWSFLPTAILWRQNWPGHWSRLPTEVVDAPFLKTFKVGLDGALNNLIGLQMSLLELDQMEWDQMVPSNSILGFCDSILQSHRVLVGTSRWRTEDMELTSLVDLLVPSFSWQKGFTINSRLGLPASFWWEEEIGSQVTKTTAKITAYSNSAVYSAIYSVNWLVRMKFDGKLFRTWNIAYMAAAMYLPMQIKAYLILRICYL